MLHFFQNFHFIFCSGCSRAMKMASIKTLLRLGPFKILRYALKIFVLLDTTWSTAEHSLYVLNFNFLTILKAWSSWIGFIFFFLRSVTPNQSSVSKVLCKIDWPSSFSGSCLKSDWVPTSRIFASEDVALSSGTHFALQNKKNITQTFKLLLQNFFIKMKDKLDFSYAIQNFSTFISFNKLSKPKSLFFA